MNDDNFKIFLTTKIFDFLGLVIKVLGGVACVYIANLMVIELSGKSTLANIDLKFNLLPPQESNFGLPWMVAIMGVLWAMAERQLRKRKTKEMSAHQLEIEKQLDINRESSGIAANGDTNPEDKNL